MKIHIYHANAGYGHRKIAEVIAAAIQKKGGQEAQVLLRDALEDTPAIFRKSYPETYFFLVKNMPALWGRSYEFLDRSQVAASVRPLRRIFNAVYEKRFLRKVIDSRPDGVICTHFFSAEVLASARRKGLLRCPLVVVITDFMPHAFWINEGTDYYWVMNESTRAEMERRGIPSERIMAGGIPVGESFKPQGTRGQVLRKYGLDPSRLSILMTSGSFGLGPYPAILEHLKTVASRVQCLMVCGNNQTMRSELEKRSFPFPIKVFGFINFMDELMEASDLLIAKSGGSTTVESLTKGVPMVVLKPIPGQETRNAEFLKSHGASFSMNAPEQILPIMNAILGHPEILRERKEALERIAKPNAASDIADFVMTKLAYA